MKGKFWPDSKGGGQRKRLRHDRIGIEKVSRAAPTSSSLCGCSLIFAARNSEDTCERTFSVLGRELSDLRQSLDSAQAASTMCADANDK